MAGKTVKLRCQSSDNPPPAQYKIVYSRLGKVLRTFKQMNMDDYKLTVCFNSINVGEYKCVTQNSGCVKSDESDALSLTVQCKCSCVCLFCVFFFQIDDSSIT